jgi:hypothetical protein
MGGTAIPFVSGWSYADGLAINDFGQVAGYVMNGATHQAYIGTPSGSTKSEQPSMTPAK